VSDVQVEEVLHVGTVKEAIVVVMLVRARKAVLLESLLLASEVALVVAVVLLRLRRSWISISEPGKLRY